MLKNDAKLAYLSGLFDGEGCASIGRGKSKSSATGYRHYSFIHIHMTDVEPVKAFADYFGGEVKARKPTPSCENILYGFVACGEKAAIIAKQLLPFIKIPRKMEALKTVIDFALTLCGYDRGNMLTEDVLVVRNNLYNRCRKFNAKGINANNRTQAQITSIIGEDVIPKQQFLF